MTTQTNVFLPAIATVAAALIAGGISLTNLILTKETKISEFRQAWIDALRDELAIFLTSTRAMARVIQELRHVNRTQDTSISSLQFTPDKITEVRHSVASSHYKIKLRLNIEQPDHLKLLGLLESAIDAQVNYFKNVDANVEDVLAAATKASDQAALVLKEEWRTVKRGEPQYRNAVRLVKIVLSIAAISLVAAVIAIPLFSNSNRPDAEPDVALNSTVPAQTAKPNLPAPKSADIPKSSAP